MDGGSTEPSTFFSNHLQRSRSAYHNHSAVLCHHGHKLVDQVLHSGHGVGWSLADQPPTMTAAATVLLMIYFLCKIDTHKKGKQLMGRALLQ